MLDLPLTTERAVDTREGSVHEVCCNLYIKRVWVYMPVCLRIYACERYFLPEMSSDSSRNNLINRFSPFMHLEIELAYSYPILLSGRKLINKGQV